MASAEAPGWGDYGTPGSAMIRRLELVAAPAGSQSEPDPGPPPFPVAPEFLALASRISCVR